MNGKSKKFPVMSSRIQVPKDAGAIIEAHRGSKVEIDFWYPNQEESQPEVTIGLTHVRAADNIRVSYDFERDGWVIEQMSNREAWDSGDPYCDPCWREAAFCPAWQFMESEEDD